MMMEEFKNHFLHGTPLAKLYAKLCLIALIVSLLNVLATIVFIILRGNNANDNITYTIFTMFWAITFIVIFREYKSAISRKTIKKMDRDYGSNGGGNGS